ncbi:MAG: hypothetical protein AB7N76_01300 [Planctomycetota bacterium]
MAEPLTGDDHLFALAWEQLTGETCSTPEDVAAARACARDRLLREERAIWTNPAIPWPQALGSVAANLDPAADAEWVELRCAAALHVLGRAPEHVRPSVLRALSAVPLPFRPEDPAHVAALADARRALSAVTDVYLAELTREEIARGRAREREREAAETAPEPQPLGLLARAAAWVESLDGRVFSARELLVAYHGTLPADLADEPRAASRIVSDLRSRHGLVIASMRDDRRNGRPAAAAKGWRGAGRKPAP